MDLPPVLVKLADGTILAIKPVDLPDEFDEVVQSWDMTFIHAVAKSGSV